MSRKRFILRILLGVILFLYLSTICYAILYIKEDSQILTDSGTHSSDMLFMGGRNHKALYMNDTYYCFYPKFVSTTWYVGYSWSEDFTTWNHSYYTGGAVYWASLGNYHPASFFAVYPQGEQIALATYYEDAGIRYMRGTIQGDGSISFGSWSYVWNQTVGGNSRPYLDMVIASDNHPWVIFSMNDPGNGWKNDIYRCDDALPGGSSTWVNQTWEPYGVSQKHFYALIPFTQGRVYSFALREGYSSDTLKGCKWSVTVSGSSDQDICVTDIFVDGNTLSLPQYCVVGESIHPKYGAGDDFIHLVFKQSTTPGDWYYKLYNASSHSWGSSVFIYSDSGATKYLMHPALSIIRPTSWDLKLVFSAFSRDGNNGDIVGFEYDVSTGWGSIQNLGDCLFDGSVDTINHGDLSSMATVDIFGWGKNSTLGMFWHDKYNDKICGLLVEITELYPKEPIPWEVRYFIIGIAGIICMITGTTYGGYKISKGKIPEGIGWGFLLFVIGVGLLVTWLWDRIPV